MAAFFFRCSLLWISSISTSAHSFDWPKVNWRDWSLPQQYQLDASVTSINLSEPVTLKANFDNWRTDDYRPGTRLYSKHVAQIGAGAGWLRFGYSHNLYYFLNFSEDTALLHYLDKNKRLSQQQEPLDLHLTANNARGTGMYLGFQQSWPAQNPLWPDLTIGARVTYLRLDDVMFGEAVGLFDPGKALNNRTQLYVDYAYTEDRLFKREVDPPRGRGYTLDLFLEAEWQAHRLNIKVAEAYSRLMWNTAPGSYLVGNMENLQDRSDAAIQYQHFRSQFDQYLPTHSEVRYSYQWLPIASAGLEYEQLDSKHWYKWVATWHAPFKLDASVKWAPNDSIWGIHLEHPWVQWILESDSANYNKSRYLKLVLQTQLRW